MTALEFVQLLLIGSGAVIGLFILLKVAYYIFTQLMRLLTLGIAPDFSRSSTPYC